MGENFDRSWGRSAWVDTVVFIANQARQTRASSQTKPFKEPVFGIDDHHIGRDGIAFIVHARENTFRLAGRRLSPVNRDLSIHLVVKRVFVGTLVAYF